MRHLLALPLLCLAIGHPALAQTEQDIDVRFLSFPLALDPDPVELQVGEGKTIEVDLPSNEISRSYQVPRMNEWILGETTTDGEGNSTFQVFGRADALASPSQLVLVVRKGKSYADGFKVLPFDDRDTAFGRGRFLFMNAATVDIAGETGGQKFAIAPGDHAIIKPEAESGATTFQAMFYFRTQERVRPFFSSKWPVSDRARGLIFFYHDPDTGRLRIHTIRDFM